MQELRRMLDEQHRLLNDLSAELQRKEVTPQRVVRLMKIVSGNVRILERLMIVVERLSNQLDQIIDGQAGSAERGGLTATPLSARTPPE
jgi:hypothetical protein